MSPLHEWGGFVSAESLFKVTPQRLSWFHVHAYLVFLVSLSHLYTHHLSPSLLTWSVELVLTSKQ